MILSGGVRIFRLKDIHGNVLWEEDDDSSDSVRPYFLINGTGKFFSEVKLSLEISNLFEFPAKK